MSDTRVQASASEHLRRFLELCGPGFSATPVLATTFRGKVGEETGRLRRNDLWQNEGLETMCLYEGRSQYLSFLLWLAGKRRSHPHELVDQGIIFQTAGPVSSDHGDSVLNFSSRWHSKHLVKVVDCDRAWVGRLDPE